MKLARSFVAIMAIGALAACGDDDDPTDEGSSLEGNYTVSSFTYTPDGSDQGVDLAGLPAAVGCPCGILSMNVDADNEFNGTLRFPGQPVANISGDLELSGSNGITVDFSDATEAATNLEDQPGTYTMVNNTLTLTLPEVTFDYSPFGGPAGDTPSVLVLVGARS